MRAFGSEERISAAAADAVSIDSEAEEAIGGNASQEEWALQGAGLAGGLDELQGF